MRGDRSAMRVVAVAALAAGLLAASATASGSSPTPPAVAATAGAGADEAWVQRVLALQHRLGSDIGLRNAPWVGTHNSFNSRAEMGPTLSDLDSNQRISIVRQLEQGIRSLELDLHWFPSVRELGMRPVVCHALPNHGGCTIEKPLGPVLDEIAGWLRGHSTRDAVLLLYLEDHLDSRRGYDVAARIVRERLGEFLYRPPTSGGCAKLPLSLTREDMLRGDARVLIVSDCGIGDRWPRVVFDWSRHEETRPRGYTDFPDCGQDFGRRVYERTLVRYYEDSTKLTGTVGEPDDGIDAETAAQMARCGVDLLGFDQLARGDERLEASVWSWAPGDPGRHRCAVQRVDARFPFGRWRDRRCRVERRAACRRQGGRWVVASRRVRAGGARARCRARDARFAVPRTGYEAQRLRLAMDRAGTREAWLGYRRERGGWVALDRR